ncbi:hypothetical protein [Luteimonas sp. A649]
MRKILLYLVAFILCGCGAGVLVSPEHSRISEIRNGSRFYNNAIVQIHGFSVLRFEAHFICESLHDIDSASDGYCLVLEPSLQDGVLTELDPALYHNKEVVLVGVFNKHGGGRKGSISPLRVKVVGTHDKGDPPPPPPEPSANNSFKPTPLRGAA